MTTRRGATRAKGGAWLALVLSLLAVLLQVNAPVARAAAMADPLQAAICHDSASGDRQTSDRRDPADRHDGCLSCCATHAVVLAGAGPGLPLPAPAVLIVQRPELAALSVRGPPTLRPRARSPPTSFA